MSDIRGMTARFAKVWASAFLRANGRTDDAGSELRLGPVAGAGMSNWSSRVRHVRISAAAAANIKFAFGEPSWQFGVRSPKLVVTKDREHSALRGGIADMRLIGIWVTALGAQERLTSAVEVLDRD
jgi:hypothetical protein